MEDLIEQTQVQTTPEVDVVAAVRTILAASREPLTLSKIRAALPAKMRPATPEGLADSLQRQVAANVFYLYPKYRSPQDRYWDRPMPDHLANLLEDTVQEQPLSWSDLRRKLPDYAKTLVEPVLEDQVAKGKLFRHPPTSSRSGPRFGVNQPEPREYLRTELTVVFARLEQLGFSQTQLREGAMELLQEEEWATPPPASSPTPAPTEEFATTSASTEPQP